MLTRDIFAVADVPCNLSGGKTAPSWCRPGEHRAMQAELAN